MNIEQAKQIPLEDFLRRLGYAPRREVGCQLWYVSPFRDESTPSFKVNRLLNAWYDFGRGSGGDIIDLVRELERTGSVSETLARIEGMVGSSTIPVRTQTTNAKPEKPASHELVRIGPVQSNSLLTYLRSRGIDPSKVTSYIQEAEYRRGYNHYSALAFANQSGGYELRNLDFKGTLGSKDISIIEGNQNHVLVFEGFFDFLSAVMMNGGKTDATAIVLNSVSLRDRASEVIRKMNPKVIEIYGDHDQAGEQLFEFFRKALPEIEVVDKSRDYLGHNDLNDWHAERRKLMSLQP